MEATIAKIKKHSTSEIWVSLREYEGNQYVDVREHFLERDSREWKPTRKGLTLQPKLLPQVINGLEALGGVSEVGTVATIAKSSRDDILIGYREFEKSRFGDLRQWYWQRAEQKPSQKGVTFRLEQVDALVEALREAEDQLADA